MIIILYIVFITLKYSRFSLKPMYGQSWITGVVIQLGSIQHFLETMESFLLYFIFELYLEENIRINACSK